MRVLESCLRGSVLGLCFGLLANVYVNHVYDDITRIPDLSWREYRRLLLNCLARDDFDETHDALYYVEQVRRKLNAPKGHNPVSVSHTESYETMTLIGITLHDMNFDVGIGMLSSLVGLGLGVAGYVHCSKNYSVFCPPNRLMLVHWKHKPLRVQKRMFGLIRDRPYLKVKPAWSCLMFQPEKIPLLCRVDFGGLEQCVSYITLDPVTVHLDMEFHTKDKYHFELRSTVDVQVFREEKDTLVADNAIKLAGMSAKEIEQRAVEVVEKGVHEVVSQIDYEMIAEDSSTFAIFLEQTIGHYLRMIGVHMVKCHELMFIDDDEEVKMKVRDVQ